MKVYKAFAFLSIFIILFYNCSLPANDEEKGDSEEEDTVTSELPWEGEMDKFTINSKEGIHLNDPYEDAGTAYVTIPSTSVKNTRWEFGVHLTFNPSANNYARFYLTSSSNILSENLNGYYIQIGGAKDNVTLYRQNGDQSKLLASGRELMKGDSSPKLYIKVERDIEVMTGQIGRGGKPFLLEGVTGSGKTEVYLHLIERTLAMGKTAIVLVPEISLTPQMTNRFISRFGDLVAIMHSGLSDGEKFDEWRKVRSGQAKVVVGARSAIFAPLDNIGAIIIDEEHEATYKQESNPRYHARDVALLRAKSHGAILVLGSATPSIETRARAQKGVYHFLELTERANPKAKIPQVEVVDFKDFVGRQEASDFTPPLLEKIRERLARKEQVVLMLNRRGYSSFVMCRDCGYVDDCPN